MSLTCQILHVNRHNGGRFLSSSPAKPNIAVRIIAAAAVEIRTFHYRMLSLILVQRPESTFTTDLLVQPRRPRLTTSGYCPALPLVSCNAIHYCSFPCHIESVWKISWNFPPRSTLTIGMTICLGPSLYAWCTSTLAALLSSIETFWGNFLQLIKARHTGLGVQNMYPQVAIESNSFPVLKFKYAPMPLACLCFSC